MGDELPPFVRTTGFAHWNRYAAVNDEFIDIHMDAAAARAAGQPDVFGMGNLRVGYQHAALHQWLAGRGDIASYSCQFRALNFLGDELTVWGRVTTTTPAAIDVELGVANQKGDETTPATASMVVFGETPAMPAVPERPDPPARVPGVHLDAPTIDWLGRRLDPLVSLPVGANDIRRWAQSIWYPEPPPVEFLSLDDAAKGPWGRLVAPRDFRDRKSVV